MRRTSVFPRVRSPRGLRAILLLPDLILGRGRRRWFGAVVIGAADCLVEPGVVVAESNLSKVTLISALIGGRAKLEGE